MTPHGIVVAAGAGTRFGGTKHTALLGGVPLWRRAARALEDAGIDDVLVVGDVPGGIPGGARRRDSVRAGLAEVPVFVEFVLVHDAARPLATAALVRRIVDRLALGDVEGVVPAVPIRDTVKTVADGRVAATVDRSGLVAVQTPQGFRRDALLAAHDASDEDASDDALLVERAGGSVAVVEGDPSNLKVTFPDDLAVAEALLERR
ncbi:MAG: IspD/TarI family cytidylyltransferase [Acidimicrobiia bacterium]|nr:IspD/TarI family cytidylyltransferase [Acidimicrobiia bacterium]